LDQYPWLETSFTHRLGDAQLPFTVRGKMIVFPGRKCSLYLCQTTLGNASGTFRILCDGTSVWRILEAGGRREVQTYTLAAWQEARQQIDKTLLGPERTAQLLRDDEAEHGFRGLRPMLEELGHKIAWTKAHSGSLPSRGEVTILEGEWSREFLDRLAPPPKEGSSDPDLRDAWRKRTAFIQVPRLCRVYLDRNSLWPYRIEWFGPKVIQGPDEVLVTLDFDPPRTQPPADSEVDKLFQPTEAERQAARELDPAALLRIREQAYLRQEQEDPGRTGSPLDPASPRQGP
jgi:hypothetical protein